MAKFKEYNQHQIMLMPPSLDEKVSEGHLARCISTIVDELDVREIEEGYSQIGCRAYHPRMLIKLLLYGYSIGIRSSRRIQKETREDLVFMWLAGMQEPDFRTISDFRKDRIRDIGRLFTQVLGVCRELGMVSCGKISIDGTKIEANSGKNKLTFRKKLERSKVKHEEEVEQILREAEQIDAEEDRLYGDKDGYMLERDFTSEEIRKALKKVQRGQEKLARKMEKVQAKITAVNEKLQRMGNDRNSFGNTDHDATLMLMKEGSLGVGYNVQMATENQVIVGFGVFQKPNDNHLLQPMIEQVEQNLGMKPEAIVTDKGYCSQSNYEYVADRGLKAAIPPQTYDYDVAARRKGTYQYSKNLVYEKLKVGMLDFLETEEGQELLNKRKHDIEPTFGDIKHNMGFRKLLLRSKPKVTTEVGLVSIAHNIKKIKSWLGIQELALNNGCKGDLPRYFT
ncbi:MAG: IS1182 family transposase [Dehalococcoidia bacterium]|nr:IS1182 family transposase [Dehalococcoidia bacterium]